MVAAAVIGGAALTAGAGIYSSSQASKQQSNAANNAANAQMQMFNQVQQNLSPYNQFGQGILPQLNNLLSGNPAKMQSTLQAMPGYQFTLNQGLQSVQNSAAARGLGSSGAALRGAADYATGLAQSNYNTYFNQLMAGAGLGENAAANVGNNATAAGGNIGNSLIAAGNAQAAGTLGGYNAINNSIGNIGQYAMMNQFMNQGGTPAASTPASQNAGFFFNPYGGAGGGSGGINQMLLE